MTTPEGLVIAAKICEHLDGLSINEALWILRLAKGTIKETHTVSSLTPEYREAARRMLGPDPVVP